jgi:hypothetical protein
MEKGMRMEKDNDILQDSRTSFFGMIKREEELDDSTFNDWKSELEKELPSFWEEMNGFRK